LTREIWQQSHLTPCFLFVTADSCKNVLVEDSYISVGDDAIAIKSGWDQYGIMYNRPCVNVTIRNVVAHSQIRYFQTSVCNKSISKPTLSIWGYLFLSTDSCSKFLTLSIHFVALSSLNS
jgi:hypothetical protein